MAPEQQVASPTTSANQVAPAGLPPVKHMDAIHLPTGVVSTGDARRLGRFVLGKDRRVYLCLLKTGNHRTCSFGNGIWSALLQEANKKEISNVLNISH